jgi:transcriptional regulator with XRE-family HTH domain
MYCDGKGVVEVVTEIKIARLRKGIKQSDVAREIGLHYSVLSGIENKRIVASEQQRKAILGVIGGSEADFFEPSGLAK